MYALSVFDAAFLWKYISETCWLPSGVCVFVSLSFFKVQIQVVFNHGRFLELDMLWGSCMVFFLEEGEKVAVRIHYVFVLRWWGGSRVH